MVMVFKSAATLEFIFPVSQSYFIGQLKLLGFGFFLANDQNYISNNKADFCDAFSLNRRNFHPFFLAKFQVAS